LTRLTYATRVTYLQLTLSTLKSPATTLYFQSHHLKRHSWGRCSTTIYHGTLSSASICYCASSSFSYPKLKKEKGVTKKRKGNVVLVAFFKNKIFDLLLKPIWRRLLKRSRM